MLFLISFLQNAIANCGSEPILENLTCSSILTGKIDFNQAGTLNDYYCDIYNSTLQEETCYIAQSYGYDCYWSGLNCLCFDYYSYTYDINYWLWNQSYSEDVYSFTCQQNGPVTVRIDNLDCDLDLYILDSTCNPSSETACVEGSDNYDTYSDSVTFDCIQGETYHIAIEAWGASDPNYIAYCATYNGNYTLYFEIGAGTGCTEDCADGNDNDADGYIDCDDSDCLQDPFCVNCDIDGDGFSNSDCGGSDCNDNNILIHPNATEICDGIDQDCDGTIDDGAGSLYFVDADGDGYGNVAYAQQFCTPPSGYSPIPGDCNDGMPNISPALQEICDGLDNNCNGIVDDGMGLIWYQDQDGDGFGSYNSTTFACVQPTGYTSQVGDCNDNNGVVYPYAPELCDNLDNDCNALIDDGTVYLDYYLDADGDGHGNPDPSLIINSCNIVDGYALSPDDCDDSNSEISPSATEIPYDSIDQDCDGTDLCDADGDGFDDDGSICGGDDCFDDASLIYPGAIESINGIDDNCDGIVDEMTVVYDDDSDGFTENAGDCDDGNPQSNPAAQEICDGSDNNCNGLIDEQTTCSDDDNDGFTENDGDCNDHNSTIHPDAEENITNGLDDNCDGITDLTSIDSDGDGVSEEGGDCDDSNPTIYNGAIELEDGLDNDCDDIVDENTNAYDDDGDGFSENDGDCHDGEATIHPDSEEFADGRDNNCDGIVDNGLPNTDDDGDGMTELAGDCDDSNPFVGLGMEEIFDGVDNDCDELVDEGVYDVDQDGFSDIQGDCDDNNGWANPNMSEMCDGFDNDCNGLIDEIDLCSEDGDTDPNTPNNSSDAKTPSGCSMITGDQNSSIPFEWLSLLLFFIPRQTRKQTPYIKNRDNT